MRPVGLAVLLLSLLAAERTGSVRAATANDAGPIERGGALYAEQCAACHGAAGEGVADQYDRPLAGVQAVDELASYIDASMPPDDPTLCTGADAVAVAEYVRHAILLPRAAAEAPVRETLARLTNRQLRESLADLLAGFDPPPQLLDDAWNGPGLLGRYYQSEGMNKKQERKLERLDARIDFDLAGDSPDPSIQPEAFSIEWEGALQARETGMYEFRVRTPDGVRLYVNANLQPGDYNRRDDSDAPSRRPLIDAWVSAGDEVQEATASIFLLGGRRYPIRVDFFKYLEPTASLRLEWKPPRGRWEVPGPGDFFPERRDRALAVAAALPADDASHGYERGAAISKDWLEGLAKVAVEAADEVEDRVDQWAEIKRRHEPAERAARYRDWLAEFAARAFRRPLNDGERQRWIDAALAAEETPELGVRRAVLRIVTAPEFLYPLLPRGAAVQTAAAETAVAEPGEAEVAASEPTPPQRDPWQTAARLALFLWDSLPDAALRAAAASGALATPDEVAAQAARMLDDPRAHSKLLAFFHHWLEIDGERSLTKDEGAFPGFNEAIAADLRRSLNLFLDDVAWSPDSDYRRLLLADEIYLNPDLADVYLDPEHPARVLDESFVSVAAGDDQRAGVLTHPYVLATFAYHRQTSPIHRGVFLTRRVVGRELKPPPAAIAFNDASFDPTLTMREKVTELTRDAACMGCHSVINPLGFSLEHYDAIGRWRAVDNRKPIDARSTYVDPDGAAIELTGPRDVALYAADSLEAQRSFVSHLFRYFTKQPPAAYGADCLDELTAEFAADQYHIRRLLAALVTRATLETKP